MDSFIRQLSCTLASFDLDGFLEKTNNAEAMTWWKTLQINKKIAIKEHAALICGIEWHGMLRLFSQKEIIVFLYKKLNKSGLIKN